MLYVFLCILDVVYEAYVTKSTTQRILFNAEQRTLKSKGIMYFANPLLSKAQISECLLEALPHLVTEGVLQDLYRNNERTTLKYCKSFKVDSSKQGLPVFNLSCCIKNAETSGVNSNSYKRFDWLTLSNGNSMMHNLHTKIHN